MAGLTITAHNLGEMSRAGGTVTEAHRSEAKRCSGTRRDGTPCAATVMGAGTLCYAHDPARATERDQARRKGGTNSATRARLDRLVPATLRPMIGSLLDALDEVHAGTLDPRQASAMASLAGAITKAYGVGVLEERVQALEDQRAGAQTA
jgi:hypothetical protein